MASDMAAQPQVLRGPGPALRSAGLARGLRPAGVVVVARGSSDYAAVFGRYLFEAATGRPAALAAPSLNTLYRLEPRLEGWLAVAVSQSGRTPEIATVLEAYGRAGARTVAVTNDDKSPLAEAADHQFALGAGRSGSAGHQDLHGPAGRVIALIAQALGLVPWSDAEWEPLPAAVEEVLGDSEPAERAASSLGRPTSWWRSDAATSCAALEAALKLREAARVRAEGWSAADFRHGPVTVAGADLRRWR